MTRRRYTIAAMTLGAVAATACSALISLDAVQCKTDADCAVGLPGGVCVDSVCAAGSGKQDAGADAGDASVDASSDASDAAVDPFRCVGDPPEQLDPSSTLNLTVLAFNAFDPITTNGVNGGSDLDVLSATVVPGVVLKPCNPLDTGCTGSTFPTETTDDAGKATFALPGNFAGYFEVTAANVLPSLFFPGNPLVDATAPSDPVPLLSIANTQDLASVLGVSVSTDPDSGVGLAFFIVYDCDDQHTSGVTFSLGDASPDGSVFFYQGSGGYPVTTLTATAEIGAAGVINYPAGIIQLTATEQSTNRLLGTASAIIRPASATTVWMRLRTH
jgi:hypothetical protein